YSCVHSRRTQPLRRATGPTLRSGGHDERRLPVVRALFERAQGHPELRVREDTARSSVATIELIGRSPRRWEHWHILRRRRHDVIADEAVAGREQHQFLLHEHRLVGEGGVPLLSIFDFSPPGPQYRVPT